MTNTTYLCRLCHTDHCARCHATYQRIVLWASSVNVDSCGLCDICKSYNPRERPKKTRARRRPHPTPIDHPAASALTSTVQTPGHRLETVSRTLNAQASSIEDMRINHRRV